jgi:hypothetical protein
MKALKNNPLLKIARAVLNQVTNQIEQQIKRLMEEVVSPLRDAQRLVSSGTIWQGKGADRFVSEIETDLLPRLHVVTQSLNDLNKNIMGARDILDQADRNASAEISDLAETFDRI